MDGHEGQSLHALEVYDFNIFDDLDVDEVINNGTFDVGPEGVDSFVHGRETGHIALSPITNPVFDAATGISSPRLTPDVLQHAASNAVLDSQHATQPPMHPFNNPIDSDHALPLFSQTQAPLNWTCDPSTLNSSALLTGICEWSSDFGVAAPDWSSLAERSAIPATVLDVGMNVTDGRIHDPRTPNQSNTESKRRRADLHPSKADWARLKTAIGDVYIRDNLTTEDVMKYMRIRYGFHASINTYKKRFREWGWSKYNGKRAGRQRTHRLDNRLTCLRNRTLRQDVLKLTLTADGQVEAALRDFRFRWEDCLRCDPRWATLSTLHDLRPSRTDDNIIEIMRGLQQMHRGDSVSGKKRVVNGAQAIGARVRDLASMHAARAIVVTALVSMVHWEQPDIMEWYLDHIVQASKGMGPRHALGTVASTMLSIWNSNRRHLTQLINSWYEVELDCLAQHQGRKTAATLWREVMHLKVQVKLGLRKDRLEWEVMQFTEKYDRLIRQAGAVNDCEAEAALMFRSLNPMWQFNIYPGDYLERSQRCTRLLANLPQTSSSMADWGTGRVEDMLGECVIWRVTYRRPFSNVVATVMALDQIAKARNRGISLDPAHLPELVKAFDDTESEDIAKRFMGISRRHGDDLSVLRLATEFEALATLKRASTGVVNHYGACTHKKTRRPKKIRRSTGGGGGDRGSWFSPDRHPINNLGPNKF